MLKSSNSNSILKFNNNSTRSQPEASKLEIKAWIIGNHSKVETQDKIFRGKICNGNRVLKYQMIGQNSNNRKLKNKEKISSKRFKMIFQPPQKVPPKLIQEWKACKVR